MAAGATGLGEVGDGGGEECQTQAGLQQSPRSVHAPDAQGRTRLCTAQRTANQCPRGLVQKRESVCVRERYRESARAPVAHPD